MHQLLQHLEPEAVFSQFEALTRIPHGSGNERQIADYCEAFAVEHGLDCIRDAENNLIITVPASAGYEKAEPVILQGHLDMVCVKTADSTHDFEKDPLSLCIDGDWIFAEGTTLGGDDGIAIAMMLALMQDTDILHPKLYCVMTTSEETGMDGAFALDCSTIADAAYLINIDTETEGECCFGCAGGIAALAEHKLLRMKAKGVHAKITLSGLDGGHSGTMIDRYGANANILLSEFLTALKTVMPCRIIAIDGGVKSNVIPDSAVAEILIGSESQTLLEEQLENLIADYRLSTGKVDADCRLDVTFGEIEEHLVWDAATEKRVLFALSHSPNGVQSVHRCAEGIVDGSLNLAIVKTVDDHIDFEYFIRGNRDKIQERIFRSVDNYTAYLGGSLQRLGYSPAWEAKEHSELKNIFIETYQELFRQMPKCTIVHAGVECGILSQKMPKVEMISIGPNIWDIHTTNERLSISSTQRTWELLCAVLRRLQ